MRAAPPPGRPGPGGHVTWRRSTWRQSLPRMGKATMDHVESRAKSPVLAGKQSVHVLRYQVCSPSAVAASVSSSLRPAFDSDMATPPTFSAEQLEYLKTYGVAPAAATGDRGRAPGTPLGSRVPPAPSGPPGAGPSGAGLPPATTAPGPSLSAPGTSSGPGASIVARLSLLSATVPSSSGEWPLCSESDSASTSPPSLAVSAGG